LEPDQKLVADLRIGRLGRVPGLKVGDDWS